MDLEQRIVLSPDVRFREVGGEGILLDLAEGRYFGLDEVGTRIWQLLRDRGSARAAFDRILEEFEVEPDRLEADLESLLLDLQGKGLLNLESPARGE
jgi:hypothetical protein